MNRRKFLSAYLIDFVTVSAHSHDGGQALLIPFEYQTSTVSSIPMPTFFSTTSAAQASSLMNPSYSSNDAIHTPSFSGPPYQDVLVSYEIPQRTQFPTSSPPESIIHSSSGSIMRRLRSLPTAALATVSSFFQNRCFLESYNQMRLQVLGISGFVAEHSWIESSRSWVDRQSCQRFGVCGLHFMDKSKLVGEEHSEMSQTPWRLAEEESWRKTFWNSGKARPEDWTDNERRLREIPQYVLDYAPFVHLYSGEEFWPCDIADHLIHTTPHLNYTPLKTSSDYLNLTNLDELNRYGSRNVYLQSDDNVERRPDWLGGKSNIPAIPDDERCKIVDPGFAQGSSGSEAKLGMRGTNNIFATNREDPASGSTTGQTKKKPCGGRSDAPAVLVAIDKGDGIVDAFWFFFYSYNLGNVVLNLRFGNHVGDWEHTLVRFKNGQPIEIFFSEHNFGEAYAYDAVEKIGNRVSRYLY